MKSSSENLPVFWKTYWHGLYSTPRAWAHKGENLIHAFEVVADATVQDLMHLNMRDQAFMLAGMAIEVQLKAILVNRPEVRVVVSAPKKPKAAADKSLWNVFYSHDLVSLASRTGVAFSTRQLKTAAALTQYINWRGRYVAPTERRINDLVPIKLETGMVGPSHGVTIEHARDLINRIVCEVKARLYGQA